MAKFLFNLSRIYLFKTEKKSFKLLANYCTAFESSADLNTYKIKNAENDYLRHVLAKRNDCILFQPSSTFKINVKVLLQKGKSENSKKIAKFFTDFFVDKLAHLAPKAQQEIHPQLMPTMDSICMKNYKAWSLEKQFFVFDIWRNFHNAGRYQSVQLIRKNLMNQFNSLSNGQSLQLLYNLSWMRQPMNAEEHRIIETKFQKQLNEQTLEETSVWCIGFFKTQTKIQNPKLLTSIYSKIGKCDLERFSEIGLCCLLKTLRYSSNRIHAPEMIKLLSHLKWHAINGNILLLIHIANLGSLLLIKDDNLLEIVIHRLINNEHYLRIKDLERICFILSLFDFATPSKIENELCHNILRHLLTLEKTMYRDSIIRCIYYLSLKGIYDTELINWALDPNNLHITYGDCHQYERQVLKIDSFTKINLANTYKGNQLSDKECQILTEKLSGNAKQHQNNAFMQQVKMVLGEMKIKYKVANALPHFEKPDILLVYNRRTKQTMNISDKIPAQGQIIRASDLYNGRANEMPIAIVLATSAQYLYDNSKYSGYFKFKLEQLKLLGFYTIVIPFNDGKNMSAYQKKKIISNNIKMELKSFT